MVVQEKSSEHLQHVDATLDHLQVRYVIHSYATCRMARTGNFNPNKRHLDWIVGLAVRTIGGLE